MILLGDVIRVVACAMEVLSSDGQKAVNYAAEGGGWSPYAENDRAAALAVWEQVVQLESGAHLALMWRVLKDNHHFGEATLDDLTCHVAYHVKQGDRFGREGLKYWVRHWARRDGSSREAARLYGRSYDAHQRFFREQVAPCLDSWLVVAKGALEPVILQHYENFLEAA